MKLPKISDLPLLDPSRFHQDSAWWQFCVLTKNMDDPRMSAGVTIATVIQCLVLAVTIFAVQIFAPTQCAVPTEGGAIAHGQRK